MIRNRQDPGVLDFGQALVLDAGGRRNQAGTALATTGPATNMIQINACCGAGGQLHMEA